MTQISLIEHFVRTSLARFEMRAASCLKAAIKTLPAAVLLAVPAMICSSRTAEAQTPATAWGYMSGSESTQVADNAAAPGSRQGALTWTDLNGNLWLFGGYGYDSAGTQGILNDLWEYSIANNTWTLQSAASTLTVPGTGECNGTDYTSGSYAVGGRGYAATWVDGSGNLWLFGGSGCATSEVSTGYLNDLWMYNIASGTWTFEGGDQTTNSSGVYGQQYAASATYLPGAREQPVTWTTSDGSVWIFGGIGYDSTQKQGQLNDLWKLDSATLEWTWVSGSLTRYGVGDFGTLGQAAASNVPGGRSAGAGTVDENGNLWLFGGLGCDSSCGTVGWLNDLWMFNPTTEEWTWEGGSNGEDLAGNAGTEYVAAPSNVPGGRFGSSLWADAAGNLWLFGGWAYDTGDNNGYLNDLWEFDVPTAQWTFMGGATTVAGAEVPAYGTEETPAITNIPGGRLTYASWNTLDGNFWLFGGFGWDSSDSGDLDDLWEAVPPTPTPSFSMAAGTYQGTQTLTISDAMSAAIYYTTNGNTPVVSSSDEYNGPVTVSNTEFVQAIAVASGRSQSLPRQANYTIEAQTAIDWQTPAAITYGTPLSSVQLDATTSIPGDFVYTPAAGTVLTAGMHTLSVTFTPSDPATAGFQAATATVTLTVNQATPAITWATPAAIAQGTALSSTQLDATASFNGSSVAGMYTYSPSAGTVLPAGTQTLNVTFTPTDATDYTTATGSVTIQVTQDTPTITWATPAAIAYGTKLSSTQLDATASYNGNSVAGSFVYSPVAGTVLPAGTQTLTVTFTPTDTTDYTTATGSVTIVVDQATPTITWPTPSSIAYGTALSSVQLDATASVAGTFVYTPAAGTVLTAGSHTLNVTFTPTDSTDYTTATASVTLVVGQATPTIVWPTPAAIAYGTALSGAQLDATASSSGGSVAGTFTYSPAAGTVLTTGTHTLTVTFNPTDTTDYTAATGSVTINVTGDAPSITWTQPAAITYGTPLSASQLNATATYGNATVAGTYVYSPAAGTILPAGTQTLTVTFVPTDSTDYASATATTTIVVNQAVPYISWLSPAPIDYGTPLSSTQLDATTSIPGTFVYSPGAGTVLSTGIQNISVTFYPTDTNDYTTAMAGVTITVLAPGFILSGTPGGQTVYAGYSTDFVITVAPANGTFNNAVALSVTGLPAGTTATFSPASVTPGATSVTSVLTVNVPSSAAKEQPASPYGRTLAPIMALLLLLPLRKVRKTAGKLWLVLILAGSLGAAISLSACASPASNTINHQTPYVLTVTGTSGANTQTTQVILTVE